MLERVLDTLLTRLEEQPEGILGRTQDGLDLRVERTTIGASASRRSNRPCVSVSMQIPEVEDGTVQIVLCRWDDMPGVLVYHSLTGGAKRPQWTHLELVDEGLRIVVKPEDHEPREYLFHWLRKGLAAEA